MELKRFFPVFILIGLTCFFISPIEAQKVRKVVIDAGHGGHDPGAIGKTSKEKDITLSIALKTGKFIEENLPDVEVVYTRKTDVFVELYRRAKIANEAKADLFISIHCNANKSSTPYGAETYVMGLHKSEANLLVAQAENAAILLEDDYHVKYEGFDPSSAEGYIFFSMLQNAYLDQSLGLASNVQKHFKDRVNLFDRGVKQAGFLVLYKTTMPSILIETGFISNAKEEKVLCSEEGQIYIASAIFRAVKDYKRSVEKTVPTGPELDEVKDRPLLAQKSGSEVIIPVENQDPATNIPIQKDTPAQNSGQENNKANVLNNGNTGVDNNVKPADKESVPVKPSDRTVVFKVQFLASKSLLESSDPQIKGLKNTDHYFHNGLYKYTYGSEDNFEAANALVKELNAKGFKGCFVVAFRNNERIDIEQAKQLQGN
ncbi:MAG TPA: N-acetylmuramoyl-L-alanine amidase [Lentimicrobium sp.]|nr:N-acetylmuramoyl-L-alanine amidase [Lentimicrobium sp.]